MTLLETMWSGADADDVAADLESGALVLSGNFKGLESDIVADYFSTESK